jgi:flagellar biosynthetic protein FliQ
VSTELLMSLGREALLLMVLASLPPVLASLVTGVTMGLLQAATQVQEPTLSVVPRLCASVLALAVAFPWIGAQLLRFTAALLQTVGTVRP